MENCGGKLLDHQPADQHGIPLEVLCKAFAEFSDHLHSVEPLPSDCTAASAMVDTALQVVRAMQAPKPSSFPFSFRRSFSSNLICKSYVAAKSASRTLLSPLV